jgi:thioredoxin-related protein
VQCGRTTLFSLGEDSTGPYLTIKLADLSGKHVILTIDKNICTYCDHELVLKKNDRSHDLYPIPAGQL